MLLESSFHSLFCLKFSFKLVSNWLLFLRVMQENKIGCFFFCIQCMSSGTSKSTTSLPITTLGKMTDADNVINLQHFGSDPVDIWINP